MCRLNYRVFENVIPALPVAFNERPDEENKAATGDKGGDGPNPFLGGKRRGKGSNLNNTEGLDSAPA